MKNSEQQMSQEEQGLTNEKVETPEVQPTEKALLQKATEEAAEWKDKYLRALAEIENSRKRLQREKVESQSFAIQNVLLDLLQPIDHFEKALMHAETASSEVKNWAIGFQMILQRFKQLLQDHGATPFNSVGEQFDPHQHEAVETCPVVNGMQEGTVVEELQKGYKMGTRVMRPARVKVATAQPQEEETQPKGNVK